MKGLYVYSGAEAVVNGGTIEGYFCGMNIGGHATINNGTIQAELAYGAYIVGGVDMFGGSVKGGTYGFAVSGVKNADNIRLKKGTYQFRMVGYR